MPTHNPADKVHYIVQGLARPTLVRVTDGEKRWLREGRRSADLVNQVGFFASFQSSWSMGKKEMNEYSFGKMYNNTPTETKAKGAVKCVVPPAPEKELARFLKRPVEFAAVSAFGFPHGEFFDSFEKSGVRSSNKSLNVVPAEGCHSGVRNVIEISVLFFIPVKSNQCFSQPFMFNDISVSLFKETIILSSEIEDLPTSKAIRLGLEIFALGKPRKRRVRSSMVGKYDGGGLLGRLDPYLILIGYDNITVPCEGSGIVQMSFSMLPVIALTGWRCFWWVWKLEVSCCSSALWHDRIVPVTSVSVVSFTLGSSQLSKCHSLECGTCLTAGIFPRLEWRKRARPPKGFQGLGKMGGLPKTTIPTFSLKRENWNFLYINLPNQKEIPLLIQLDIHDFVESFAFSLTLALPLSENGKGRTNKECRCAGMVFAKLGQRKPSDPTGLGM
ncbi:hypothetical protein FXO37_00904 [Capsicum annuum]|nr:hypothetical protein FXO37_00904 [Capsicum annuum]